MISYLVNHLYFAHYHQPENGIFLLVFALVNNGIKVAFSFFDKQTNLKLQSNDEPRGDEPTQSPYISMNS